MRFREHNIIRVARVVSSDFRSFADVNVIFMGVSYVFVVCRFSGVYWCQVFSKEICTGAHSVAFHSDVLDFCMGRINLGARLDLNDIFYDVGIYLNFCEENVLLLLFLFRTTKYIKIHVRIFFALLLRL